MSLPLPHPTQCWKCYTRCCLKFCPKFCTTAPISAQLTNPAPPRKILSKPATFCNLVHTVVMGRGPCSLTELPNLCGKQYPMNIILPLFPQVWLPLTVHVKCTYVKRFGLKIWLYKYLGSDISDQYFLPVKLDLYPAYLYNTNMTCYCICCILWCRYL